ncbi:MAG: aminoacyl-tRNA hydrolase, partial [Candidatus Latescibacteria bacterium]|nr:aminoacyl-tRNA hydrolase [Candidatus Latescibacterota bacterium]
GRALSTAPDNGVAHGLYVGVALVLEVDIAIVELHDLAHCTLGDIRLRAGGSDGGHNGLASISDELDGAPYARLRIGVGAPPPDQSLIRYVLSPFDEPDRPPIREAIDEAIKVCESFADGGYQAAADRYAARSLPPRSATE